MATRYSGSLRIRVSLNPDSVHYSAYIWNGNELLVSLCDLRRSRHHESTESADGPRAYDRIAAAALSFGDAETNGTISEHADSNENGFIVKRRWRP